MLLSLLFTLTLVFGADEQSTMDDPYPEENTLDVTLDGGSSYAEILAADDEDTFLTVCSVQMTDLLDNTAESVECVDVSDAGDDTIEVTLYSTASANLDTVQDELLADGVDMLVYGTYSLFLDLVTFTQEFEQVFDSWSEDTPLDMFPVACWNYLSSSSGENIDLDAEEMMCSEPYESTDGKVMVDFTVTMDQELTLQTAVASGPFEVLGFDVLNAKIESGTCEKLAQANIVMMVSDDADFVTYPEGVDGDAVVNTNCFMNYTESFFDDRRNIDNLAGNDLTTTFAIFAETLEKTAELVALVESFGYYTVLNAQSITDVQNQRNGNGCECDIEEESTFIEVIIDDYEISGAGLAVGMAGVLIFFCACVFVVSRRDALFTNQDEVDKQNKKDSDALAQIKEKEDAATDGSKVLPQWDGGLYQPRSEYVAKEEAKVGTGVALDVKEHTEV